MLPGASKRVLSPSPIASGWECRRCSRPTRCRSTISFGIAAFPEHGEDAEALTRAADQALYAAKEMGRNRCVHFTPELRSP